VLAIFKVDPMRMSIKKFCDHCKQICWISGWETHGYSFVFKPLTLVENYSFFAQFPRLFWSDVEAGDLALFIAFPWFRVEFRQFHTSIHPNIDHFQPLTFNPSHSVGSDPRKRDGKKQIR
jgi:hypothetical protein